MAWFLFKHTDNFTFTFTKNRMEQRPFSEANGPLAYEEIPALYDTRTSCSQEIATFPYPEPNASSN
jgi:hypothetical protein